MKVSTDSILLGSWAKADEGCALDIGTGCGLLSLMLAQRFQDLKITAIDIDEASCQQSLQNAQRSPWKDRMEIIQNDVRTWRPQEPFDTVICNPPYFDEGLVSQRDVRANARHGIMLSFKELWTSIDSLVKQDGNANLVMPATEFERLSEAANEVGWYTSRRTEVLKYLGSAPGLILTEWKRSQAEISPKVETLVIHEVGGGYTAAFKELTADFYL
jgi:tRNA1Val (adenine37-N6)-methyltransferase